MGITLKNNKSVTKNMTIKGDDGVGIKTITSGTPVVTEEKTTTPITVTLTDETTQNFNVEAKNGSGGGTGEKKYFHQIALLDSVSNIMYYFNLVTTTPKFNSGDDAFNEVPVNTYISCAPTEEGATLTSFPIIAGKESNSIFLASLDFTTKAITYSHYSHTLELMSDNSIEI